MYRKKKVVSSITMNKHCTLQGKRKVGK